MKASQSQRDLEQRPEGQTEGQGHEVMVGRLETITESEEKNHADEQPIIDNAPPQYECYFNNNKLRISVMIHNSLCFKK